MHTLIKKKDTSIAISPEKGIKKIANNEKTFKQILYILFLFYAVAILYGVINHEPWRDEAQAWLLARDTSLAQLLKIIPAEGHPPLWYFLLMPFAKLGMPYQSLNWLTAFIIIGAVYLLLFKTKLHPIIKLLLPFSYFLFFEYSLIGRNYCLIIFFVAAILSLYPKRFEYPLFALSVIGLFNSHVLAFSLAFTFAIIYSADAYQNKKKSLSVIGGIILMFAGGLYLVPYMAMSPIATAFKPEATEHVTQIANAIKGGILLDGDTTVAMILFIALGVLLITRTKAFILLQGGIAGTLYILAYRYNLVSLRHQGMLFVILLAAYGIAPFYENDIFNIVKVKFGTFRYGTWIFIFIMLWQLQYSFASYNADRVQRFSGAKDAAAYIIDHHLQDSIIVGYQAWAASAILPYLKNDKRFYYAECQRYGSYYINDSCLLNKRWSNPPEYAVNVAFNNFKDSLGKVIFVLNIPLRTSEMKYMELFISI